MFSLVVTLLSIALVAVLTAATLFYGSAAWAEHSNQLEASRLLNEGQQLQGAHAVSRLRSSSLLDMEGLIAEDILSSRPTGWHESSSAFYTDTVTAEVCEVLNSRADADLMQATDLDDAQTLLSAAGYRYACLEVAGEHRLLYRY